MQEGDHESLLYMMQTRDRVATTRRQGRRHTCKRLGRFPSYLLQATDKGLALTVLEAGDITPSLDSVPTCSISPGGTTRECVCVPPKLLADPFTIASKHLEVGE